MKWVATIWLGIQKATPILVVMFFCFWCRKEFHGPKADSFVTRERAVMVATLVVGLDIDFDRTLLAEIHGRAFNTSTSYPFLCLIFNLYRDAGKLI